jgi:translation initiation factor 1 (eIF-1/SUI1)
MATSYDIIHKTIMGNKRVHIVSATIDAASANIETGLSVIHGFSLGVVSMTTAGITMKKNIGSGATARNGILNINSAVSGDVFNVVVFGV